MHKSGTRIDVHVGDDIRSRDTAYKRVVRLTLYERRCQPELFFKTKRYSYVSHMGSLVMGHPALTIHHMVWAQPDSRFDYRTPLLMGRPDPEQSSSSYGPAVGNNAPHEWSGRMFVDSHFLCGAALRRRVMITFGMRRWQSSH
jgi:hypothetical protein